MDLAAAGQRPRWPLHAAALLLVALFLALGCWQLARRAWKLELLARVDARVHAAPQPAPPPGRWPAISAAADEYRHVQLSGHWEPAAATLVAGASVLGSGYWQLVPLRTDQGWRVLVNRGFVAPLANGTAALPAPDRTVSVTGLLRLSEPRGRFLRRNDPAAGRWYSRDVAAIGAARGLTGLAPYFVDADAPPGARAGQAEAAAEGEQMPLAGRLDDPVAGLTVIDFPNNHLAYALTWFALAALTAGGWWRVGRAVTAARPPGARAGCARCCRWWHRARRARRRRAPAR